MFRYFCTCHGHWAAFGYWRPLIAGDVQRREWLVYDAS